VIKMKTPQILKVPILVLLLWTSILSARSADLTNAVDAALKIPVVTGPEIWKDPSQPLDQWWIRQKELVQGGQLVLELSPAPNKNGATRCPLPDR